MGIASMAEISRDRFLGLVIVIAISLGGVSLAAWPGEGAEMKTLNNFVTELTSVPSVAGQNVECAFTNPRNGWVFFSLTGGKPPKGMLDDRTDPLVWRVNPETKAFEAMQWLAEGKHRLRLDDAAGKALAVRAIPEIAYCYYPTHPHIACYGPYDWAFMTRFVLSDVNTLVSRNSIAPGEFDQWIREGRQWIGNASLPGLSDKEAPAVDAVYKAWAENPGVAQRGFGGMIVDEFGGSSAEHYRAWSEAVKRLHDNPAFAGRTFYAWCGDLYGKQHELEFSRLLMDLKYRFVWEKYLHEEPTEDKARESIVRNLAEHMAKWKAAMPGFEHCLVICPGYLSAPPESLNTNPSVDYHVFMDMQFEHLAADPAFAGLYGIMEYMADYADEESLRYAQKLFRHYCIEGKRERFNHDPYILPHLDNPDLADGLNAWRAEAAEKDSIDTKEMKGFSWLEGRYPLTPQGDRFCWMKRSAQRPNRVSQTVKRLEPGRLYSVKLISADFGQLDKQQQMALAIDVRGAKIAKDYAFQFVYPSSYDHEVKPYDEKHPAYMSFHRVVFRAEKSEAELVIQDWIGDKEPGGSAGQETIFNFVEVQPFHEP